MKTSVSSLPLVLLVVACSRQPSPPPLGAVESPGKGPTATEYLFDDFAPPRLFSISVAPGDWAWLNAHATEEKYVPAAVTFEGNSYGGAAIRYKGAYGSLFSCFDAKGNKTCPKLSMKVSFNEYDKTGRFFGVRKLVFNSCNRDPTCLHERLAYAMFRAAGIAAPRAVHALVAVNDEAPGLYLLVEHVDHEFLEDHFKDPGGNLYKEAWPTTGNAISFAGALQTNEDQPDVSRMIEFGNLLLTTPPGEFNEVIDQWMDRDRMASYLVVDQMLNNWDGIWKFYCNAAGQCGNHNFYLYDDPSSGRFVVIPRDLDFTYTQPNTDMARSWWDDGPEACKVQQVGGILGIKAPQCDPLLRGLMLENWDRYTARLAETTSGGGIFSIESQQAVLDRYRAMIIDAIEKDPNGPGPVSWRKATAQFREVIAAQHEEAIAVLEWKTP